jgi:hypothetical protein
MAGPGKDPRGLLKPKLSWPAAAGAAPAPAGAKAAPKPAKAPLPKGAPSNAIPLAQYNLEQLQKMAASRGLTVEKLVAQMVQQYLKEGGDEPNA